jgi:hypothetical protein
MFTTNNPTINNGKWDGPDTMGGSTPPIVHQWTC